MQQDKNFGIGYHTVDLFELIIMALAMYRHLISTRRIAILLVETRSVQTFRLFSPRAKIATVGEK